MADATTPTTGPTALADIDLRDPLQGFDIDVSVARVGSDTAVLQGAFTGFMCRITNQTEAYLPIGQRTPRMLDGEIIIVWSLEQAMVTNNVVANTFGTATALAYANGRQANAVPRQVRFNITMFTKVAAFPTIAGIADLTEWGFQAGGLTLPAVGLQLDIMVARVDTGSFGVMAGRRMASSSWQGTAEYIKATPGG